MSHNAWNEGYFTDVDYVHGYYAHLNPIVQRFYMLAAGYAPLAAGADSVHCELGFGQGTSISAHAIAQPHHWMGTDFTPSQAAFAREVTARAGVNAQLLDDSFEQLLERRDIPQFDTISLHGIWTWISPENRRYITEFARRHLKPGGAFSVSYNAQPGWSARTPMRHLLTMRDTFAQSFKDLPESMQVHTKDITSAHERRIGQALDLTHAMFERCKSWTVRNPAARPYFDHVRTLNRTYLAHEYFNSSWNCMFFADVAAELDAAKLSFVCAAEGNQDLRTAFEPDALDRANKLLATIAHPVLREQVRDYWRFSTFRRDIFQRGSRRLTELDQHIALFDKTQFVLTRPLNESIELLRNPEKSARFAKTEYIWVPILEHLAADKYAPKSLARAVHQVEKSTKVNLDDIVPFLTFMVQFDCIAPCQDEADQASVRSRCRSFNRWALERHVIDRTAIALVSPVTGGAISNVSVFEKLLLLAWAKGGKTASALVQTTDVILKASQQVLCDKDNKPFADAAAASRELKRRVEHFLKERAPMFAALQILDIK